MDSLQLREEEDGVLISVRVKPRSAKNAVEGVRDGLLLISVRAAPTDGEANSAVQLVLAEALQRPKSAIELKRGHKGREKVFKVTGIKPKDVFDRLELA